MSRLKREGNPPSNQLASPVPQAWDPSINDFREITGQNLGGGRFGADGVQWGKTASGLFVPVRVTNDGVQEVQLSGTIVKPHVFFDNQEVRATTGLILGTQQTVNSKGITILVRNALDAEISIVVLLAPNNHGLIRSVVWDGEGFRELVRPGAVKIPANQNRWFILNTYYTFLDTLIVDKMNIGIEPSTEPTTGFVTILGFTKEVS